MIGYIFILVRKDYCIEVGITRSSLFRCAKLRQLALIKLPLPSARD